MKKTNFLERIEDVAQEALDFIKSNVKKGKTIVFLTEKEREEDEDKLYELPIAYKVSKHGFYDEFAITSITNKGDEFIFNGICKGEADDDNELSFEDISTANLCAVADLISKKLK